MLVDGGPMPENVGSIIAEVQARDAECAMCASYCWPKIIERTTRNADHFERLICSTDGASFRRAWIGGYAR